MPSKGARVAFEVRLLVTFIVAPRQSLPTFATVRMSDALSAVLKVELFDGLDDVTAGAGFVLWIVLGHGLNLSRGGGYEDS